MHLLQYRDATVSGFASFRGIINEFLESKGTRDSWHCACDSLAKHKQGSESTVPIVQQTHLQGITRALATPTSTLFYSAGLQTAGKLRKPGRHTRRGEHRAATGTTVTLSVIHILTIFALCLWAPEVWTGLFVQVRAAVRPAQSTLDTPGVYMSQYP